MRQIALTKGFFAYVDDEDFDQLKSYKWFYSHGYAASWTKTKKRKRLAMHRFIMKCPQNLDIDHINGDKLDNRKSNLRICTTIQNCRNQKLAKHNKSGYKGVHWKTKNAKWCAQIGLPGKRKYLGLFNTKEEAAEAYNIAAKTYDQEYFTLNKIIKK